MALLSIPFTTLQLVSHAAGGAILRNAGGYIAHTYVGADIVGAFASAGAALQSMGSSAVALASNPYIAIPIAIGVVAIGTYCYFHGIPAPVAETLVHAGLAAPSEKGLMIAVPKLALALVLLGAAGYLAYRFYENLKSLRADREHDNTSQSDAENAARGVSEKYFGPELWSLIGEAVWATTGDATTAARDALDRVSAMTESASDGASRLYKSALLRARRLITSFRIRFS